MYRRICIHRIPIHVSVSMLPRAVLEVRKHPPSTLEMSTMGPLVGGAGGPRAPTISARNVNSGSLGGGAGGPGAPTINARYVDGEPPGRR
jgi:hypothetical protein